MSSVSFDVLAQKFEILPEQAKEEVLDFIEFLLQKRKPRAKKVPDRKKILLDMSCWNDEDVKQIADVRRHMNKWEPEAL